ncbi:MAG: penicillin-binding protein 2, partial [Candidatus Omnitrophica bacterium]|nr:penicillin-binding protein 2 [Candidatus Omnitrophota bacterium]
MPRLKVFNIIVFSSFLLLTLGLGYTQLLKGPFYYKLSEKNRIRLVPIPAPRGIIYERNGKILVDNRISFDCFVIPEEVVNKDKTLRCLSQILGVSKEDLHQDFKERYLAPFAPLTLVKDIPKDKAFILEELKLELPGIEVRARPFRHYVYGEAASHILGYLGEIDEPTLAKWKDYGYKAKDLVGRFGIEKFFDDYLRGKDGGIQIEVDNLGRFNAILGYKEPQKGNDLQLTIDIRIQKILDNLLSQTNRRGAIIVMDPCTGEILALSSFPRFNPNIFIKPKITKSVLNSLLRDPRSPMLNRAISGQYLPGSIFKILVAVAGLEDKKIKDDSVLFCGGSLRIGEREFHCWKKDGHGQEDIRSALTHSCNIFFYQLGLKLGVNKLYEYANRFGLGELTKLELPGEAKGFMPSKTWKMLTQGERWYEGETANLSIGQGYILVSPIQAVRMISIIANGGKLVQPHLVNPVRNTNLNRKNKISNGVKSSDLSTPKKLSISDQTISIVKRGLTQAVEDESGTGHASWIPDLTVAAKTGTAQTELGKSYGWFVGFCPVKNPKVAFAILLEEGGSGELASRLARM